MALWGLLAWALWVNSLFTLKRLSWPLKKPDTFQYRALLSLSALTLNQGLAAEGNGHAA